MATCPRPRQFKNTDKRQALSDAQEALAQNFATADNPPPLLDSLKAICSDEDIDSTSALYIRLSTRVGTIKRAMQRALPAANTTGFCISSHSAALGSHPPGTACWPAPAPAQHAPPWWVSKRIDSSRFAWLDPGCASLIRYRQRDDSKGVGLECAAAFAPVGTLLCQCTSSHFEEVNIGAAEQPPWGIALREQYSLSNLLPITGACHPMYAINTGPGINCVVTQFSMRLYLYAGRDINEGDELLIDYGHDADMQSYLAQSDVEQIKAEHAECQNNIHLVESHLSINCKSGIEVAAATTNASGDNVKVHGCPCAKCKCRSKRPKY